MVPAEADDIKKEYEILHNELVKYNPELLDKRRVLAITKSDMLDEGYHREISEELARQVKKLISEKKELTVLVVGLGNRQVTPDALGPDVVDNLKMTRHIILEYGAQAMGEQNMYQVSGLVPGVMAQTGMETLEIVKGVINETRPDVSLLGVGGCKFLFINRILLHKTCGSLRFQESIYCHSFC